MYPPEIHYFELQPPSSSPLCLTLSNCQGGNHFKPSLPTFHVQQRNAAFKPVVCRKKDPFLPLSLDQLQPINLTTTCQEETRKKPGAVHFAPLWSITGPLFMHRQICAGVPKRVYTNGVTIIVWWTIGTLVVVGTTREIVMMAKPHVSPSII